MWPLRRPRRFSWSFGPQTSQSMGTQARNCSIQHHCSPWLIEGGRHQLIRLITYEWGNPIGPTGPRGCGRPSTAPRGTGGVSALPQARCAHLLSTTHAADEHACDNVPVTAIAPHKPIPPATRCLYKGEGRLKGVRMRGKTKTSDWTTAHGKSHPQLLSQRFRLQIRWLD